MEFISWNDSPGASWKLTDSVPRIPTSTGVDGQRLQWHGKGPLPPNLLVRPLMNGERRRRSASHCWQWWPSIPLLALDETTKELHFLHCMLHGNLYMLLYIKWSRQLHRVLLLVLEPDSPPTPFNIIILQNNENSIFIFNKY